jgi:GR25 family glycosyltransferase involved in LPS biosynthesis
MDKLVNFPPVYFITLEHDLRRQESIRAQFATFGIEPIPIKSRPFADSEDVIIGRFVQQMIDGVYRQFGVSGATLGCLVSHLKAIDMWLKTSDSDYAFFCEDDLSLETVNSWNFNWHEFMRSLPKNWQALQLLVIRDDFGAVQFRQRAWDDWAHTAYVLKRSYARRLLDTYVRDGTFRLDIDGTNLIPLGENVLFLGLGVVYSWPMFVERVDLGSTFQQDLGLKSDQKKSHVTSRQVVLDWWAASDGSLASLYLAGRS